MAASLAISAAIISGCGSSAPTKQDVVARADAICSSTLSAARALTQGDATYYTQLAKLVSGEAKKLRALPRPAKGRAELDLYIASVGRAAAQYLTLATAERTGDQAAIGRVTAQLAANPAPTYAAGYGLRECSGTAGTLVSH